MAIRLLITDDHAVVRRGIRTLLEDEPDLAIVGEATDGDEALALIPTLQPDLLLLDITMPRLSGIDVVKVVAQQFPAVRVLIFSMHTHTDYILSAVRYGAVGYLPKDSDQTEMLRAIRAVAANELYFPPAVSSVIIRQLVTPATPRPPATDVAVAPSLWKRLTAREAQILTCLIDGLSSRAIAERFAISPNTVANQRASILRKAGAKTTVELIRLALRDRRDA